MNMEKLFKYLLYVIYKEFLYFYVWLVIRKFIISFLVLLQFDYYFYLKVQNFHRT
jgi:hypothetical protein